MPTLKELAFDKANLLLCKGYSPSFIDKKTKVSLENILNSTYKKQLPKVEGNRKGLLNYTDLSILYHAKRKVPFVAAYNIDGYDKANQEKRPSFQLDPRIKSEIQLGKEFYKLRTDITEFEIGHMASNNEMGRGANGKLKAYQTFHFTNSVPQAEKLNTGLWKGLETYIIKEAATARNNKRICVFTGPMLTNLDPAYIKDTSFKIPLIFFKVVVFLTPKGIYSTAFMMSHEKKLIEDKMFAKVPPVRRTRGIVQQPGFFNDFPYKAVFQVNIPFLEKRTGLKFSWRGVKQVAVPDNKQVIEKIKGIKDAKDAKAEMKKRNTRKIPLSRDISTISEKELKSGKYRLNIILP